MYKKSRKTTAFIVLIAMLISIFPTTLWAADESSQQQIGKIKNSQDVAYYDLNTNDTLKTNTASKTSTIKPVNDTDRVTMTKTIAGTGTENEFDVTLAVTTTEDIKELVISPNAAVVLVVDCSNSMKDTIEGKPTNTSSEQRMTLARKSANDFINNYTKDAGNSSRMMSNSELTPKQPSAGQIFRIMKRRPLVQSKN